MKKSIIIATAFFCCTTGMLKAQDSVRMAVNKQYDEAGKFKRWWLGQHYRKEWATEVNFAVINLDTTAGGLRPLKVGGGQQTKSLRLEGADGKEYVLRSVNKDPSKTLPPELVGTFADDIIQDQISSAHPYAPLVVAELAKAAGIRHITPQIVYVPKSARLGEFEKEFAGTICIFEERPSGNEKNILNSEKLYERLYNNPNHRVDAQSFLKARLFDTWIGDWDRHEDQWVWFGVKKGDKTFYEPIPRDRDQAMPKLDGIIPQLAARKWAVRKTQSFDYTIRDINGLNLSGHYLDRNFVTELTRAQWLYVADELQKELTDEKIEKAVRQLPQAIYELTGEDIVWKLKRRRNDLYKNAAKYYEFVVGVADVTGTGKQETFTVTRINSDSTRVTVSSGPTIIFNRIFLRSETKEIRLYGLGSNDVFHIDGHADKGMLVRIVGGNGEDRIVDSSFVSGGSHKTKIYDEPGTLLQTSRESRAFISRDTLKNNYYRRANRFDVLAPKLAPGFNPDDGVYIGGGFVFKKQQFGKTPYGHMQSVWANYAISTGAWNFWYQGIFRETFGKWDLHLDATINAPNFIRNFYGMGNESKKLNDDWSYYRVRTQQVIISPSVYRQFGRKHGLQLGISGQSMKVEATENRFITESNPKGDSILFDRKYYGNAFAGYTFSTIDNPLYPRKGVRIKGRTDYTINPDEEKSFFKFSADASIFFSFGAFTVAARNGASTNTGDEYEFFQANTLGGLETLRGFRRDRFSGKTRFFSNTELRYRLNTAKGYILRGDFGLYGFFDNGRVWFPGEESTTWHTGFGGGFWFLAYNKLPFTVSYAASKEEGIVTVKAGFLF